ncbi:MAG: hypothetical protein EKK38_17330 [Hyphomicrobium sp.]|nr:MAG: hypothetical protein EKK38_17330 [Hyphomicrobium sp.]
MKIRLIGFALALAAATSAEAMPVAPVHQPDSVVTQVRFGCGLGRTRINGVCVSRRNIRRVRRDVRRCRRWNGGVCVLRW